MRSILNKKAQFESKLLVIILIFVIAIILFFFNKMASDFYDKFDEYLESNEKYNDTEAHQVIKDIKSVEQSNIWDYAFLAIFIGFIIQIVLFSFATRVNIGFYWVLILVDLPILIVGVVLSNIWQEIAADPEFATTITRFPITNTLLGTYFPIAVTFIIFIFAIVLFGKRPDQP